MTSFNIKNHNQVEQIQILKLNTKHKVKENIVKICLLQRDKL